MKSMVSFELISIWKVLNLSFFFRPQSFSWPSLPSLSESSYMTLVRHYSWLHIALVHPLNIRLINFIYRPWLWKLWRLCLPCLHWLLWWTRLWTGQLWLFRLCLPILWTCLLRWSRLWILISEKIDQKWNEAKLQNNICHNLACYPKLPC